MCRLEFDNANKNIHYCESNFENNNFQYECFVNLKSGAESGWDFTSRWIFDDKGEPSSDLRLIHTRRNIPVDLNSFLYKAFAHMGRFYMILHQEQPSSYWVQMAEKWKSAINKILYHEEDGIW